MKRVCDYVERHAWTWWAFAALYWGFFLAISEIR